jgi:1-deoxy-D-xylulose-5-phosphate reductoisomerase
MGQRITIDSASMFNKALELIETREYFGFAPDRIEVIVHPQSIIHSLVGFRDGGIMAHLGPADMRHAIGYALNWPDRAICRWRGWIWRVWPADLRGARRGALSRAAPGARGDGDRGAGGGGLQRRQGGRADAFIAGRIGFLDMAALVEQTLDRISRDCALEMPRVALRMCWRWTISQGRPPAWRRRRSGRTEGKAWN